MGAHYFLGQRLLGTSPKPPMWADEVKADRSIGFMCEVCGEIWGRVIHDKPAFWGYQMRLCAKHGDGSFIAAWSNKFEELPPEVLQYELQLRLNHYEVNQDGQKLP